MCDIRRIPILICLVSMTLLTGPSAWTEADCIADHSCCTPSEAISCCLEDRSAPVVPASPCQCAGHSSHQPAPSASTGQITTRKFQKSAFDETGFLIGSIEWKSKSSSDFAPIKFNPPPPSLARFRLTLRWRC